MKIVVALIVGLSLGCLNGVNELASLREPSVTTTSVVRDGRTTYLEVEIGYHGVATSADHDCAALAVDATLDDVPFAEQDQGGWHESTLWFSDNSHCARPTFVMRQPPAGATTIKIVDASKTITVEIPELTTARGVSFATPTPALRPNDSVVFDMTLARGDVLSAVTDVVVRAPDVLRCGQPLFQAQLDRRLAFVVPDVYTPLQSAACNDGLPPGTTARVDLDLILNVAPEITNCSGATKCNAFLTQHTKLQSSLIP